MEMQPILKICVSLAILSCLVSRVTAQTDNRYTGITHRSIVYHSNALAANPPGTPYIDVTHRNIAYNDFVHNNISKDRLAVQRNANNAEAQELLGLALYEGCWRLVGESLYETPSPPAIQKKAFAHLKQAVMLQPNQVQWQFSLGLLLSKSGSYEQAIPHLKRCVYLFKANDPFKVQEPNNPLAQEKLLFQKSPQAGMVVFALGDAYKNTRKMAEARSVWHTIVAFDPQNSYYVKIARRNLLKYPPTHDH